MRLFLPILYTLIDKKSTSPAVQSTSPVITNNHAVSQWHIIISRCTHASIAVLISCQQRMPSKILNVLYTIAWAWLNKDYIGHLILATSFASMQFQNFIFFVTTNTEIWGWSAVIVACHLFLNYCDMVCIPTNNNKMQ